MNEEAFIENFSEIVNDHAQQLMKMICIRAENAKDALSMALENAYSRDTLKMVSDEFNSAMGGLESALSHPQCGNMQCDCMTLLHGLGV